MPTTNESLLEYAISHAVGLQRYGTHVLRRVLEILNDADNALADKLAVKLARIKDRGFDMSPQSIQRLKDLQMEIRAVIAASYAESYDVITEEFKQLVEAEKDRAGLEFKKASPVLLRPILPPPRTLAATVTKDPFLGSPLKEWLRSAQTAKYNQVVRQIRIGLTTGSTLPEIIDSISGTKAANYRDGKLEMSRRQAEAIIRTAVNQVANRVRDEIFQENDWLIKSVKWVSTLDTRTTPICRARDGKTYPVNSGPRPPAHFRCRSIIVAVTKSWKELSGVDTPEGDTLEERFHEQLRARGFTEEMINREVMNARASMDGLVPDDLTYSEWLRKQPASVQNEILGVTRAKLFRAGKITLDSFVDDNGRQYSLQELRQREQDAFKAAGL